MYRALLGMMILLAGCTTARLPSATPVTRTETITLETEQGTEQAIDAVSRGLVAAGFPIALVNERLGLIQTDPAPLEVLAADFNLPYTGIQMRLGAHIDRVGERTLIQLRAYIESTAPERLSTYYPVALYVFEQTTQRIARDLGAPFTPRYTRALVETTLAATTQQRVSRTRRLLLAAGIVAGSFFVVSLLVSALTATGG